MEGKEDTELWPGGVTDGKNNSTHSHEQEVNINSRWDCRAGPEEAHTSGRGRSRARMQAGEPGPLTGGQDEKNQMS